MVLTSLREAGRGGALALLASLALMSAMVAPEVSADYTIQGRVFEDVNYGGGAGRAFGCAGCTGIAAATPATVQIFDAGGALVATGTTGAAGVYSITVATGAGGYPQTVRVRVVNSTVRSTRAGATAALRSVQTYRTDASTGSTVAVTDRVGGENPTLVDPAAGTITNAQSVTPVLLGANGLTVTGVDFGFNFDTVVNTNNTGQGSLRQFITNANTLTPNGTLAQVGQTAGQEVSIFMISDGAVHPGLRAGTPNQLTAGRALLTLASDLPGLTDANTSLDGSTQTTNVGNTNTGTLGTGGTVGTLLFPLPLFDRPEVEVDRGTAEQQLAASGAGTVISSIAFHRIVLTATGNSSLIQNNLVGMRADGTISTAAGTTNYGITAGATATNVTIRHNYVRVNNSGIRADGFTTGLLIELNEVDSPPVSAGYHTNTFDAILLIGSGTGATITHNLTLNQRGGGLEFGFQTSRAQTNVDVFENTVRNCGYTAPGGGTASTEGMGVAAYQVTGTNFRIRQNVVTQNSGPGLVVMDAWNIDISQNSFFSNGPATAGGAGLGIELDETSRDPNGYGAASGVTPNDGLKPAASATAPNRLMDYPILTGALLEGGNLHVMGFVGSAPGQALFGSSRVELFLADETGNDQNGPVILADGRSVPHGEGRTYLGTLTTAADGTFRATLAVTGVSIGSLLTATAADAATGGNTSEFGPNFPVQGVDYGDAPDSYLTTLASNGPRHGASSPAAPYDYAVLRIGAAVSAETDARGNPVVLDGFGDTFDDGRTLPMPALGTLSTPPYTVPITVVNQTGGPATLVAWIDFNRDGTFAATEASTSLTVPAGTNGTVNVVWTSLPGLSAGRTYARFRLTTDTNVGGTGGGLDGTKPAGLAVNGEVEDYALDITVGAPTPAVVHSVRSLVTREGTFLEWRTAAETSMAGFVVERLDGPTGPVAISDGVVPALHGDPQGGVYRLLDPGAPAGPARYVITGIEADGTSRAHGPFAVMAERDTRRRGAWDPSGAIAGGGLEAIAHAKKAAAPVETGESPALVAQAARTAGALKVEVTGSGLVLVPASTLSSAFGLAPSAVTASLRSGTFSLTNRGRSVAWAPSRDLGGLLFFAEAIDSPYTAANVYFLRARSGPVVTAVPAGSPAPVGSPNGFLDTIHTEQDTTALTGQPRDPDGDYWGWDYVQSGDPNLGRRTFHVTLPELVPGRGPSSVRVGLMPVATTGIAGEHHLRFRVNGVLSGEERFEGLTDRTATFEVAAGVLVAGDNAVEVEGVLDPGTPYSYVFVNDIDVDVVRTFKAVSSRLAFVSEGVETIAVGGFADPGVEIWDVTDPVAPRRVTGAVVEPDASAYRVRFVPEAPLRRYAAASTAGLLAPSRSVFRPTVKLFDKPSGRGSLLIVAGPGLEASSERLAEHRRAQKTTAVVVPVEDVFDAYGDGLPTPRALRAFLRDGYRNAGARWALLAGSGTWDYRNLLGLGVNRVPPMMVATARGLFPSDTAIGDFDGDGVPEVPVGRVTARTAAEMDAFVDKVIAYEASPVPGPSLLLADNREGDLDFSADSDRIAQALAGGRATQKVYMDLADLATARGALFAGWAARPGFVNFIGHGGVDRFAAEGLLTSQDVVSLTPGATPVVSSLSCVINLWAIPGYSSLGEELVRSAGKGAVASWAPTGYSTSDLAPVLGEEYVSRAWLGAEPILGDAVRSALAAFRARGGTLDMALVYSLLGDPSLPVRR